MVTLSHALLLVCTTIGLGLAAPHHVGTKTSSAVFIEQRMLQPDPSTLPEEMFGPGFVWETKGMPTKVEEVEEPYPEVRVWQPPANTYDSPIFFQEEGERLVFPSKVQVKPPQPTEFHIDQRMMLPEGSRIPNYMYGPNYAWDNKGWPTYVGNVPEEEEVKYDVKTPSRNSAGRDALIVFQDSPAAGRTFGYPHRGHRSRHTDTKTKRSRTGPAA